MMDRLWGKSQQRVTRDTDATMRPKMLRAWQLCEAETKRSYTQSDRER
jgi:hypothetical protein